MNIPSLKKKLKKMLKFFYSKVLCNKKLWTMLFLGMLAYKLRHLPGEISSYDFLKLLESNHSAIKNIQIFDTSSLLIEEFSCKKYICDYPIANLDRFNHTLLNKGISFNHFTGFNSLFMRPFNQIMILSSLMSYCFVTGFLSKKKYKIEEKVYIKDEDLFKVFICNDDVKLKLRIILDQLKNPEKYLNEKMRLVKGCLLYGKPGTGKTFAAKCLSQIKGINFVDTCASEFIEIYVGTGPKRVRECFEKARANRPAIIFIDEIDSIGIQRPNKEFDFHINHETYSTLNQLLSEMDGVKSNDNIVVFAATNREDLLDSALVRSGRFDFKIHLTPPDKQQRMNLYKLYLNKIGNYDEHGGVDDEFLKEIVEYSNNFTGADIESVVAHAANFALMDNRKIIDKEDLQQSYLQHAESLAKFKK